MLTFRAAAVCVVPNAAICAANTRDASCAVASRRRRGRLVGYARCASSRKRRSCAGVGSSDRCEGGRVAVAEATLALALTLALTVPLLASEALPDTESPALRLTLPLPLELPL